MMIITHLNGPYDGKEVPSASNRVILGKHDLSDIDLSYDPKATGWVMIMEEGFHGYWISCEGEVMVNEQPLKEHKHHAIPGDRLRIQIGQSLFSVSRAPEEK